MVRIMVFEDNDNYREALSEAFAFSKNVCLTKAYPQANQALARIQEYEPDVVLMDIQMPGTSGLDALAQIKVTIPTTKVLMQSQYEDEHRLFVSLCRGASGYIHKSDPFDKMERAIVEVHEGGGYYSPKIAGKISRFFQNKLVQSQPRYTALTDRELEVLNCIKEELTYNQIAKKLFISEHTVHSHRKNIYEKLHVNSRSQAIVKALEAKLI